MKITYTLCGFHANLFWAAGQNRAVPHLQFFTASTGNVCGWPPSSRAPSHVLHLRHPHQGTPFHRLPGKHMLEWMLPYPQRLYGVNRRREGVRRLAQHVRVPAALHNQPVRLRKYARSAVENLRAGSQVHGSQNRRARGTQRQVRNPSAGSPVCGSQSRMAWGCLYPRAHRFSPKRWGPLPDLTRPVHISPSFLTWWHLLPQMQRRIPLARTETALWSHPSHDVIVRQHWLNNV